MRRTETRFENDVHTLDIARTTSSSGLTARFPFRNKNMTAWFHLKAFLAVLDFTAYEGNGEALWRGRASHESFLPFVLLDFGPAWSGPAFSAGDRSKDRRRLCGRTTHIRVAEGSDQIQKWAKTR